MLREDLTKILSEATTGKAKWERYFASGDVKTIVYVGGNKMIPIYDQDGKLVIDNVAPGTEIKVLKMTSYDSKYTIKYKKGSSWLDARVSESFVKKPIASKGATENLRIASIVLIKGGTKGTITIGDKKVSCYKFTSLDQMKKSVLSGLKSNKNVSKYIVQSMENYFDGDLKMINWNAEVTDSEKNELGKYAGELLIGAQLLSGIKYPFAKGKTKEFAVPDDPSYPGVDSFVVLSNKTVVPISSKFGGGAKASLFSNVIEAAMKVKLANCFFQRFVKSASKFKPVAKNALPIVYDFGIKDILKVKGIRDAKSVYTKIKAGKIEDPDVLKVIEAINKKTWKFTGEDQVKKQLPVSMTAFFNRLIADMLQKDTKSLEAIKDIIGGKEFWQANLEIAKFKKGTVSYKVLKSGEAKVKIIGSKSAIQDLTANQGKINYELAY